LRFRLFARMLAVRVSLAQQLQPFLDARTADVLACIHDGAGLPARWLRRLHAATQCNRQPQHRECRNHNQDDRQLVASHSAKPDRRAQITTPTRALPCVLLFPLVFVLVLVIVWR
jgi:hypothetical protein